MKGFTRLALQCLENEFPHFGELLCFRCFQLGTPGGQQLPDGFLKRCDSVQRLAGMCKLPAKVLAEQLEDRDV